jgi:glycine C-acetyltransferase
MKEANFDIKPTQSGYLCRHALRCELSQDFAAELLDEGISVTGF